MGSLFDEFQLGGLQLSNRLVMAPVTRARAGMGDVPTELMAKYYGQRAEAGLVISISRSRPPGFNTRRYSRNVSSRSPTWRSA